MMDKSPSTTLTDLNIPDFIGGNGLFDGHYPMLEIFRAPVFSREFLIQPAFQFRRITFGNPCQAIDAYRWECEARQQAHDIFLFTQQLLWGIDGIEERGDIFADECFQRFDVGGIGHFWRIAVCQFLQMCGYGRTAKPVFN